MKPRMLIIGMVISATVLISSAKAQQNATTAADHEKLATVYAEKANQLAAEAAKHDQEAAKREKIHDYFAVKNPAVFGPQHCRGIANRLRREAEAATAMAGEHSQMAAVPDDHRKIAAQYSEEASRLTAQAVKHEQEAVTRQNNPNYFTVKNPAVFGAQHCRKEAVRLRARAAETQALGEEHKKMTGPGQ